MTRTDIPPYLHLDQALNFTEAVDTTELADGEIIAHHAAGLVLWLAGRREYPGTGGLTAVAFEGLVMNWADVDDAWVRGACMDSGTGTPDRPVWTVQGNELARWLRVRCAYFALCEYPATTVLDCGPVGDIPACARCAAKADRLRPGGAA